MQPDQDTTDALTKFWESEEPGKPASALSPEDSRIQIHYQKTHSFIPDIASVVLPRKEQDLTLGESRSQAVKRFLSHEKSLLQKGQYHKFQQGILEYLSLGCSKPS